MIPSSPSFSPYSSNNTKITNNKNRILKTIYHHPFYSSSPIINIESSTTTTKNIINIDQSLEHTPKTKTNPFKIQRSSNINIQPSSPSSGYSINDENDVLPLNRYKSTSSYKQSNHNKIKQHTSPYHYVSVSKQQPQHDEQLLSHLNCSQSSQSSPSSLLLYNLKHQLTTNSNNTSEDNSESNNNVSSLSIKTNPPTTPISSSLTDSSASSPSQFKIPTKFTSSSEPHYVTPASSTANVSSSTSSKFVSVNNSNWTSSTHTTFSRSSSVTSLGSFDIKSNHSSLQSEYSCDSHRNGYETPSGYSDLPDSPGEQFNHKYFNNNLNKKISSFKQIQLPFHEETSILTVDSNPKSNDITVIERTVLNNNYNNMMSYTNHQHNDSTCSTDSKHRFANKTSQNSTLNLNDSCKKIPASNTSKSNGSSAYNSQSNSFLIPSTCHETNKNLIQNNETDYNDDEDLVTYDQEGSIINEDARSTFSSRSNVSSLSFPTEPSADLEFIRKILASRKSSLNNTQSSINTIISTQQQHQSKLGQMQKHPWSVNPSSYTPPVKLNNNIDSNKAPLFQPLANQQVNRSLFTSEQKSETSNNFDYDDTDYFLKYSNVKHNENVEETEDDQDDDKPMSIASVPSEIRLDICNSNCLDKLNFNRLFSKLSSTESQNLSINEYLKKKDQPILDTFDGIKLSNNFQDNIQDLSINNQSIYNKQNSSDNTYIFDEIYKVELQDEYEDDDQKILNEFIDEVLPIAMAANNNTSYNDEENQEENDLNESDSLKYELENYDNSQYCLINNRGEMNNECVRTLPKIEEVDEEENVQEETLMQSKNPNKHERLKRLSFSKTISTSSIRTCCNNHISNISAKCPVIQMNRTARLRQQNIKQSKINKNKTSNLTTSVPTKRQASTNLNENKKFSCTKPTIIDSSNSQKKTIPVFPVKSHSSGFNFNLRK
jgi:hypothetical protein